MTEIVVIAVIILFVYPLLKRALLERVQPARERMADLGCEMLDLAEYDDEQKSLIAAMLEDAYEWRFMVNMALTFPSSIWKEFFGDGLSEKDDIEVLWGKILVSENSLISTWND